MKKLHRLFVTGVFAVTAYSAPMVAAQDIMSDLEVAAYVDLVSDYRFRGISMTNKKPTAQGGIDLGLNGFYAGAWASGLNKTYTGADTEIDLVAGYGFDMSETVSASVGYIYYGYVGGSDLDFHEINATLSATIADVSWGLGIYYSPSQSNLGDEDNTYLQATAEYPLPDTNWSFNAAIGYETGFFPDALVGGSKWDYSVGTSYAFNDHFSASLSLMDTNRGATREAGTTVLLTIGASF